MIAIGGVFIMKIFLDIFLACLFLFTVLSVLHFAYETYKMCISPDMCKGCRGDELNECRSCPVKKNMIKNGLSVETFVDNTDTPIL